MIPNLRFNKRLTRYLLNSKSANPMKAESIQWNIENHPENTYGTYIDTLFKTYIFIIQPYVGNVYRLVVLHDRGIYGMYLLEDLNLYTKYIPAGLLNTNIEQKLVDALEELKEMPNSGILEIDEDEEKIYLYDHKNY